MVVLVPVNCGNRSYQDPISIVLLYQQLSGISDDLRFGKLLAGSLVKQGDIYRQQRRPQGQKQPTFRTGSASPDPQ